jgi:hypothetical protein
MTRDETPPRKGKGIRKTALILGALAVAFYLVFILQSVLRA